MVELQISDRDYSLTHSQFVLYISKSASSSLVNQSRFLYQINLTCVEKRINLYLRLLS